MWRLESLYWRVYNMRVGSYRQAMFQVLALEVLQRIYKWTK